MSFPVITTFARAMITSFFALYLLTGCMSVTLVTPYDAQIDTGMTRYAQDLETFMAKMVAVNGQPQGTYPKNIDFYATQTGRLGGLILRAEAQDVGRGCLLSDKALKYLGKEIPASLKPTADKSQGTSDGCTVQMLKNIKTQLGQLSQLQKAMGGFNQAVAISALKISTQGIRAVLVVEMLKKKGLN